VSDVLHDAALERPTGAGHVALGVQQGRDVSVGVLVEELIDERDDLGAGLTPLPGVQGAGERERRGRAAPKANVRREPLRGFDERDILHQQADHPFSFAIGRVRVVPESWKIGRHGKNPRTRLRIHADAIGVSVSTTGVQDSTRRLPL
jgi:hypothetical protein